MAADDFCSYVKGSYLNRIIGKHLSDEMKFTGRFEMLNDDFKTWRFLSEQCTQLVTGSFPEVEELQKIQMKFAERMEQEVARRISIYGEDVRKFFLKKLDGSSPFSPGGETSYGMNKPNKYVKRKFKKACNI